MNTQSPPLLLPDTNILIHYVRQDALARRVEATYTLKHASPPARVSIVTVGELRAFALQRRWGATKQRELQRILDACVVVPLDLDSIVDTYAELSAYSVSIGRAMGDNDLWIAATARVTGALLLTTDRDFDHLHPAYIQREWIDPNTRSIGESKA